MLSHRNCLQHNALAKVGKTNASWRLEKLFSLLVATFYVCFAGAKEIYMYIPTIENVKPFLKLNRKKLNLSLLSNLLKAGSLSFYTFLLTRHSLLIFLTSIFKVFKAKFQ